MPDITVPQMPPLTNVNQDDLLHVVTSAGVDGNASISVLRERISKLSDAEIISINSNQSITPTKKMLLIISDTTTANITIDMLANPIDGGKVVIYSKGTGLTYCKGPGLYLGSGNTGTVVSEGFNLNLTWSTTENKYIVDDKATANYTSGAWRIISSAKGWTRIYGTIAGGNATNAIPPIYITNQNIIVFPLTFSTAPTLTGTNAEGSNHSWIGGATVPSTTQHIAVVGLTVQNGIALTLKPVYEGFY